MVWLLDDDEPIRVTNAPNQEPHHSGSCPVRDLSAMLYELRKLSDFWEQQRDCQFVGYGIQQRYRVSLRQFRQH
jgi:hypothetical protein